MMIFPRAVDSSGDYGILNGFEHLRFLCCVSVMESIKCCEELDSKIGINLSDTFPFTQPGSRMMLESYLWLFVIPT